MLTMLFLFNFKSGFSQNIPIKKSHPINLGAFESHNIPASGTLNIVAIMVEFQPDTNRLTSGTGIFGEGGLPYMENNADKITIDPLPHDKNYFESHLEFTKNYFNKVSKGQLDINYQVLPDIYRLDKEMAEYSPIGETFTYEKIAYLIRDAWTKVEENGGFDATGLNADETAFVIFHAGVGRDIELTGTSLDITPLDIPSLYLGKENLEQLLEDPTFDGIPINNGTFKITNSMVIPRTESRRGTDIQDDEFVFPLSINGLLSASVGSHLGLPDLFNTETGESGIGNFGLMDGAGFFSYNGLFPPEPSAWEKIYLGWETPFLINEQTPDSVVLPAASLDENNSIAKFELSSKEYFLIENRHRDIDGDGVKLTIRKTDGTLVEQHFDNKDEVFTFQDDGFEELFEPGILIDVDNYDWSLPGGYDIGEDGKEGTDDDRFLNGGILIWHIDESVIEKGMANNTVNNANRRGVMLVEADGSQDIGKPIADLSDNSAAYGTPFDFWWKGNDYRVVTPSGTYSLYKNEFSPTSTPNNSSNSGSPSYFRFYDFSDNLPYAHFKVEAVTPPNSPKLQYATQIAADNLFSDYQNNLDYPVAITKAPNNNLATYIIPTSKGTYFYYPDSQTVDEVLSENTSKVYADEHIFLGSINGNEQDLKITPFKLDNDSWQPQQEFILPDNNGFLSSHDGDTITLDNSTDGFDARDFQVYSHLRNQPIQESMKMGAEIAKNYENRVQFSGNLEDFDKNNASSRSYAGTVELSDNNIGFFVIEDQKITIANTNNNNPFTVIHEGSKIGWSAIADIDDDGDLDFIFVDYDLNIIDAKNTNGGEVSGFPIHAKKDEFFVGTPLIADINGNGEQDILILAQSEHDINIRIFDNEGKEHIFSPLYIGGTTTADIKAINPFIFKNNLIAVGHNSELKHWVFEDMGDVDWSAKYGNQKHNKIAARLKNQSSTTDTFEVLNHQETYNWPNPAGDETNLRFQVVKPGGEIDLKVISMSGSVIYKNKFQANGGAPEEVTINTSNWPSGGYYAMVKATVDGKSESKLVKIAVAH